VRRGLAAHRQPLRGRLDSVPNSLIKAFSSSSAFRLISVSSERRFILASRSRSRSRLRRTAGLRVAVGAAVDGRARGVTGPGGGRRAVAFADDGRLRRAAPADDGRPLHCAASVWLFRPFPKGTRTSPCFKPAPFRATSSFLRVAAEADFGRGRPNRSGATNPVFSPVRRRASLWAARVAYVSRHAGPDRNRPVDRE